jgi:hypothetical protein
MNKYIDAFKASLDESKALAARQTNPLHRQIVENYIRHAAMECCFPHPRWLEIFSDELMAERPYYNVQLPGEAGYTRYEGDTAIQQLYRGLLSIGMHTTEVIRMAVADWGFAIHEIGRMYVSAKEAADLGYAIEKPHPDRTYCISVRLANYWRFDSHARLQGEDIHLLSGYEVQEVAVPDLFSFEQLLEEIGPYMGPTARGLRHAA